MNENDKERARLVSRQVLSFRLGQETYGVDILAVKEIRGWAPVTRIPQAPEHVLGVLNLRGAIVPIIDLRMRFGLPAEFTPVTVVIVLQIEHEQGQRECGIVVDSVSDVVEILPESTRPAPDLTCQQRAAFIAGLAEVDDHMLILLDVTELVGRDLPGTERAA
jgi:purine-binding chemotaxis protein CheW